MDFLADASAIASPTLLAVLAGEEGEEVERSVAIFVDS
jgi:hypothetical protein